MALWFHDAVYEPDAPTGQNEQRSADLFLHYCEQAPTTPFVTKVCELILLTTHTRPPPSQEDGYVIDIDLAGFGLPWDEFFRDSGTVREERASVPDERYYPAYSRFLQSLLGRPRIFYTDHFHALYEAAARGNIQRLLDWIAAEKTP
jgi:predicted metal-dependent HD superfamily phosphohydrolase